MAYSTRAKLAVIKMHQDGMSLREIEREFKIDRKDLREWIHRYKHGGVEGISQRSYFRTTYEMRCAAARDYLENGLTYTELGARYGMSRSQLKLIVAKVRSSGYDSLKDRPRGRPRKSDAATSSSCSQ